MVNGRFSVDGYVRRPGDPRGDLVLEVFGCYWVRNIFLFLIFYLCLNLTFFQHGCPQCYPGDHHKIAGDQTAEYVRKRDAERLELIRKEADVKIYWEHEIQEILDEKNGNNEMATFFAAQPNTGPIDYRDAFLGAGE